MRSNGAATSADQTEYLSYLLRLWRSRSGGRWVWHASLESPHTAERQVFGDLEALYAFLDATTALPAGLGPERRGGLRPGETDGG